MSEPIWYSLDFGHAYIRVARARASDDAAATTPELVQFGGRPALPNLALLSPDGRTLEAVGAAITDHELDIDALDRLYEAASLDDSPQSEGGRVARLLLAHVVAVLQREHAFQPNDPIVEAFVALPIAERNAEQTRQALEARLSEAGLATTTAVASAIGALVHYCHGRPAPGRYLVIDNGYVWTRFALVECSADGLPQVVAQTQNSSGGQSFDKALVDYFARSLVGIKTSLLNDGPPSLRSSTASPLPGATAAPCTRSKYCSMDRARSWPWTHRSLSRQLWPSRRLANFAVPPMILSATTPRTAILAVSCWPAAAPIGHSSATGPGNRLSRARC